MEFKLKDNVVVVSHVNGARRSKSTSSQGQKVEPGNRCHSSSSVAAPCLCCTESCK